MPTLREVEHIRRQATIEGTLSAANSALPTINAARTGSVPDDSGSAGFFEDDADGVLTYQNWFRAGDAVGTGKLRPY